jgi:riboflavin biosynthesis pyrimidine reductase
MSIDGRIASADDSLDFLDAIGADSEGGAGWEAFVASLDAVVVGAGTLRWLVAGGHGWPHDDLPTWLLSHDETLAESVRPTRAPLRRVEDARRALDEIAAARLERVWCAGGGAVAAQLLALDAIDELLVTVAPTVLGAGPSLVAGVVPQHRFELVECRVLGGDAARLRWLRAR